MMMCFLKKTVDHDGEKVDSRIGCRGATNLR